MPTTSDDASLSAFTRPLPASHPAALLWTKLRIPPTRAGYVPRARLMRQLEEGLQRKLTLVSAPAGFGKTTCLSAWAADGDHAPRPVAWLTLDASDNDPVRFWAYVLAAVDSLLPGIEGAVSPWLPAVQAQSSEVLLTALVNSLAAITYDYLLILDDYHVIDVEPIHAALARLLEMMPAQMHVVIAGRVDPPLPLARLRARHQLASVRAADLRFSVEEAGAFLQRTMGLDLPGEMVAVLDARTEGWIVGLQLAALSMQDCPNVEAFVAAFSGSHRYVLDYLVEEVLQRQPPWLQTFLLQTSILDRLCASLCTAVIPLEDGGAAATDQAVPPDAQAVLECMERANLFLIPLYDERRWYRYHHLFADLLRHYLRSRHPDMIVELHRRASAWYADNQLLHESVEHALAGRLYPRAAQLIEQAAWPMLEQRGEVGTLLRWLQAVPDAEIRARPRLCVMYAWLLLLSGRVQAVEQWLPPATAAPAVTETGGLDDDAAFISGYGAASRAYLAIMQNDLHGAAEHASQALAWLSAGNGGLRGL
ncbi:MAG TPA: hypothetical protein VEZ12_04920, partial [Herpetosiphonaceae bacterium]|nr:hypothetical protein [Herpetosiphonaceae bacterium]